jgi:hypothetical protein
MKDMVLASLPHEVGSRDAARVGHSGCRQGWWRAGRAVGAVTARRGAAAPGRERVSALPRLLGGDSRVRVVGTMIIMGTAYGRPLLFANNIY